MILTYWAGFVDRISESAATLLEIIKPIRAAMNSQLLDAIVPAWNHLPSVESENSLLSDSAHRSAEEPCVWLLPR